MHVRRLSKSPNAPQVNRSFKVIFQREDIWKDSIKRACETYGLYEPSYPLLEMSLQDLKRAALAPFRVASLIQRCPPGQKLLADSAPTIVHEEINPRQPPVIRLIPGGRFLLTVASPSSLQLWDLGVPGRPVMQPPVLRAKAELLDGEMIAPGYEWIDMCVVCERIRVAIRTTRGPNAE